VSKVSDQQPQRRKQPTVEAVLEMVSNVEGRLQHTQANKGRRRRQTYRSVGTWLVEEGYLNRLIFDRRSQQEQPLPGLELAATPAGLCWLMWKRAFARKVTARCAAPVIRRKKTNVRALYIGAKPFSTKVILDQTPQRLSRLEKEINARERASAAGALKIPALLEYDLKVSPAFYAEEIVWGRACDETDAELISTKLFPSLAKFYRASGISWEPVGNVVAEKFSSRLRRAMQHVKWDGEWCKPNRFLEAVDRLVRSEECLPCSFCHGDVQPSNLIVTPEKEVYVVDWEAAKERPIAFDLFKMTWFFSWGRERVKELVDGLPRPGEDRRPLPFSQQLLLANLAAIAVREARVEEHKQGARGATSLMSDFTELFAMANRLMQQEDKSGNAKNRKTESTLRQKN